MVSKGNISSRADEIETIYNEFFPKVYNYVYYKLLDRNRADDLVGDIFVRIVENMDGYDENKGSFEAWLFRIARNALIDEFRRRKPAVSIDADVLDIPSDYDAQLTFIQTDERRELYKAVAGLTQRERSIVSMKYFAGMTNREIAIELNMNESTVSTVMWRTLKKLRQTLADYIERGV